ncbi:DNA polymerase III subunit beta [Candidatus Uhrbacteria bacterium RIFCSPLOWO2_01_FULL_47_24]|uniref:Beta sliding clamp n=1 Tax=Candidatus Uhrbacteria bacterium RIFCSPLOWO2_01_FULL_47_24 TaxID=1802401 RepID=A0A1F7UV32_9BACT|nr:MAG: DNA polymerase III subunit beta [Candidatus Uhrbacteria bacterium RIFCSPHIGHO2_01_FULL_47_11]OGL67508.1 MAG: DNA polymerase III subunit beta [Candidatus Uhrbacteria bacterium RIFCSPHIGHO2_02_FULL_46_47]OGL76528.1 MAG: DNA polymerase III subunit beta [Candidatus Uhrbacteria bacterium RIFCSPHIGHO2_12_FULL_47_11]OGL82116.1 MAG: DNA polymerase III subunit beta [Candidatus Uhrbacteria bacterium RIFCSPLOWO2_01_FULL_47_24]OGL83869.1 MAG: DNA polymerase III subunit beta [Candidatus Uhrbacteria 
MRFSCTQENLYRALSLVSKVAARAGNLPILSNIHIKAEVEGIILKATNLEIGITYQVRGKVEEPGEFTIPGKLFTDYIAFLPKERVDITLENQALRVVCGKHHTSMKGLPAADFPVIPAIEEGVNFNVSLPGLLEGLEQVLFAISPTETRPEISGAHLAFEGGKLTIAGTDSYRLAEKTLLVEGDAKKTIKVIVPLRALAELARICAQATEETGTAKLMVSQSQLAVILPSVEFVSRLIEGQYPDYKAIVPTRFGIRAAVAKGEFAGAVKAAGLFSKSGVYDVAVELDGGNGAVKVAALNSQTGEHVSALEGDVQGESAKIAFNWKYLLDGVNALKSEKIVLKATDSSSPTMLTEENGSDYFYIVMPIKE